MISKRRTPSAEDEALHVPATAPDAKAARASTLADIRANAIARMANAAHDVAHTIADLEAWRAEIDATIAFLKAQR